MSNPPPPYSDITGISRAIMKDNAQETLSNYNGNARPGELVVNLETDPPALYVGNNAGELTAITSGGSSYGNANVVTLLATFGSNTISTTGNIAGGNITASGQLVGGNLQMSTGGIRLADGASEASIGIRADGGIGYAGVSIPNNATANTVDLTIDNSAGNITIQTGLDGWHFYANNVLSAPGDISTVGNIVANIVGAGTQLQGRYLGLDTMSFVDLPDPQFGLRAFINDANLVAAGNFGAQVSGGGGNTVPIWSNGSNWYIG